MCDFSEESERQKICFATRKKRRGYGEVFGLCAIRLKEIFSLNSHEDKMHSYLLHSGPKRIVGLLACRKVQKA